MVKVTSPHFFLSALLLLFSLEVKGMYYDTLPQGVRVLGMRYVQTDAIDSTYGNSKDEERLYLRQDLNADALKEVGESVNTALQEIKRISPEAYESMSLGEFEGEGSAQIQVRGMGFGYGLTDWITAYASVPFYQAQTDVSIRQKKRGNLQTVAGLINKNQGDQAYREALAQALEQFPGASGELLQSVVTNHLGYKPVGDWQGEGLGDTEIGSIFRLTDEPLWGLAASTGVVLPTGRTDHPDMLQDFAFGDGQTDVFVEFGGGVKFLRAKFGLDAYSRYTYQFANEKTMRVPEDEEFFLTDRKGTVKEKLGNKLKLATTLSYYPNSWLTPYVGFLHEHKGKDSYESGYGSEADQNMEANTEETTQFVKLGMKLSSVNLYQSGSFVLPLSLNVNARTMVNGQNTPKYSRVDVELRLFF